MTSTFLSEVTLTFNLETKSSTSVSHVCAFLRELVAFLFLDSFLLSSS